MDELYEEMLCRYMSELLPVLLKQMEIYAAVMMERRCYQALRDIQAILRDADKTDQDCFVAIDSIIDTFGKYGGSCGSRHDF